MHNGTTNLRVSNCTLCKKGKSRILAFGLYVVLMVMLNAIKRIARSRVFLRGAVVFGVTQGTSAQALEVRKLLDPVLPQPT